MDLPRGPFAVFGTEGTLTPPIFILRSERERMSREAGRVTPDFKEWKPAGGVFREEHVRHLAFPPAGWRELAGLCVDCQTEATSGGALRLFSGPLDDCQSPGLPQNSVFR